MVEHEIHPQIWWEEDHDQIINSIKSCYAKLVAFFQEAARNENYVLTYVTA